MIILDFAIHQGTFRKDSRQSNCICGNTEPGISSPCRQSGKATPCQTPGTAETSSNSNAHPFTCLENAIAVKINPAYKHCRLSRNICHAHINAVTGVVAAERTKRCHSIIFGIDCTSASGRTVPFVTRGCSHPGNIAQSIVTCTIRSKRGPVAIRSIAIIQLNGNDACSVATGRKVRGVLDRCCCKIGCSRIADINPVDFRACTS